MSFSYKDRESNISKMAQETFDIAIIGGGISGAGVARDAASRGMRVALVEAHDFASGTSSRSSKLIHGGIRYLENLEFGLVFEALSERKILFDIAPHLVHPLRFMLPIYKDSRVGMFKLGLGMWLYDILSTFDAPKMHERLNRDKTLERASILQEHDLVGSYEYSDAYMEDDRLVLETLRSAASYGAICANYTRATGAEFENNKVVALKCTDEVSKKNFSLRAKHFVSTVGPWTDSVAHQILGEWKNIMRPSKGVHLTFTRQRLPLEQAVVMVSDDEKRIVFAIPRHEMVIIGTTDTDFKDDPLKVHTDKSDVDYLLAITNEYFPGAKITEADIIASYAGVRPLVHDGSDTESKTSREHLIFTDNRNITFLTGGKYTTYRRMAEQTVESVLEQFVTEDRLKWSRNKTREPLNPLATHEYILKAKQAANIWAREFGVDVGTVNKLIDRFGYEAQSLLEKWASRFKDEALPYWKIEAQHAIYETMCLNINDFYLRRTPLFLTRKNHGHEYIDELSKHFAKEFGLIESQRIQTINATRDHEAFEMGWRKSASV